MQTQTSNTLHNTIMEASGKDRLPMLAPGNYVRWKSITKRYIDTKPNHELIHYYLKNPPYKYTWADKVVPVSEGSPETTTETYIENYKNVSQDIRIDNDIYSTVDACPNVCEMWKAIKRLILLTTLRIPNKLMYTDLKKFQAELDRCNDVEETVGTTVVQKSGIQCYNFKEFGHVARECQKPKRAKDAAYHREKMLLYAADNSGAIFDTEPLQK
nr:hypothetical protein [Tanacetum cinerariifolium]